MTDPFRVDAQGDGGEEAEDVTGEDEVVAAGVGVLDDPPVVELVVDGHKDDGEDDADDADGDHGDVEGHGDGLDDGLDDGPVGGRLALGPPDQLEAGAAVLLPGLGAGLLVVEAHLHVPAAASQSASCQFGKDSSGCH